MNPKSLLLPLLIATTVLRAAEPNPAASPAALTEAPAPEFRGVLNLGQQTLLSLSTPGGTRSSWVKVGDTFEGWELVEFRQAEDAVSFKRGATSVTAHLVNGKIATASPDTQKATLAQAEDLIRKMNFEQMLGKMIDQQKKAIAAMMKQQAARSGAAGISAEETTAFQNKIMDVMWAEMKPEAMKADVAKIYSELFTAEELRGQSEFYSTAAGQALIAKQPEMQEKMMAVMMPRMMAAMPKIQQMGKEFAEQQKAKRAANPTPAPAPAATPIP